MMFSPSYVIFVLTSLISLILQSHQKLLFVYEHIRHGTRGPGFGEENINITNTDIFNTTWQGNGEITNIGLRMMYLLGQLHRQKYGSFLKNISEPTEIMVLSSPKRRTIMSAYSLLRGIFPNDKAQFTSASELTKTLPPIKLTSDLHEYIKQQEQFLIPNQQNLIPVHIMDHYENKLLLTDKSVCARMETYKQKSIHSDLLQGLVTKINATYGKQLTKYFGINFVKNVSLFTVPHIVRLCDVFVVNYENKKDLTSFQNAGECTEEISPLALSKTMPRILKWMQTHIDLDIKNKISVVNKHAYPKYVIYSAHDKTLAPFQLFMKHVFGCKLIFPSFGSNLFLELHRNDSSLGRKGEKEDYYIRYYFNDELLLEEGFENFKRKVNEMLWSKQKIIDFCTVIKDLSYVKGIAVLIGIVIVGVGLICLKMQITDGKREGKSKRYMKRLRKYNENVDDGFKGMSEKMEEMMNVKC